MAPRGRILLIDDHPALLRVTESYLKRQGYDVVTAATGAQAWQCFQQDSDAWAAAIVDATLPDRSGIELAESMLRARSDLRAILWSGSPVDEMALADFGDRVRIAQKPMPPSTLLELLVSLDQQP